MQFTKGQTVVYPPHGPATITSIISRTVKGVDTTYFVLEVQSSNLIVSVPVDNAIELGMREVHTQKQIDTLLAPLTQPTEDEETQWSRRLKANREKLNAGDISNAAEVMRDLMRRNEVKGLSLAEREMLRHAGVPVTTEIALALEISIEDAEAMVQFAINCQPGAKTAKIRAVRASDLVAA